MKRLPVLLAAVMLPAGAAELEGTLQWSRRTELAVPVSGVIAEVSVNAGQRVQKGAVLLALDPAPFQASIQQADSQVTLRKIERDEAARDAKQAQELFDRTVLSVVELENAKNRVARAEASLKDAMALRERARWQRRVSSLKAPFEAIVLSRHAEPGQSIAAELKPPVLVVIAAAGEYSATARIGADRATGLKVGQSVQVRISGKSYAGTLRSIAHEPVVGHEPYVVEAVFSSSDVLHAGKSARIVLP